MKRISSIPRLILTVFVLFAGVIIMTSLGHYIASPLENFIEIDEATISTLDDANANGIVIDEASTRISFVNENGEVEQSIRSDFLAENPRNFSAAASNDNGAFVTEVEHATDSSLITAERIIHYASNGNKIGTVAEFTYDESSNCPVEYGRITSISLDGDNGYVVMLDDQRTHTSIIEFDASSKSGKAESPTTWDKEPVATLEHPANASGYLSYYEPSNGSVILIDPLGNVYTTKIDNANWSSVENSEDVFAEELVVPDGNGGVSAIDAFAIDGASLPLAPIAFARSIGFWLSMLLVIALAVVLIVRRIITSVREHNAEGLGKAVSGVCIGIVILCVVTFATYSNMAEDLDLKGRTLQTNASLVAHNSNDLLAGYIHEYEDTGTLSEASYTTLTNMLKIDAIDSAHAGFLGNFVLSAVSDEGKAVVLGSSSEATPVGVPIEASSDGFRELLETAGSTVYSGAETRSTVDLYAYAPIVDSDGAEIGAVISHANAARILSSTVNQAFILLGAIMSALISISFLFLEAKGWASSFEMRRKMRKEGQRHPEVALARPLRFFAIAISSVDSALLVVFADEMARASGMEGGAVIVSIPVVAQSLGYVVGTPAFNWMAHKLSARKVLLLSACLSLVCYVACAYMVASSNLIGLIVLLFLGGIFSNVIFSYSNYLPLYCESTSQRSTVNRSNSAATISGSALAILAAGYLAQTFGNSAAYLLGAVISAFTLLFVFATVPRSKGPEIVSSQTHQGGRGSLRAAKEFLSDHQIIAVLLFAIVPAAIATGYKNFLFPLFANAGGMSKSDISDVVAICNALVFYSMPLLTKVERSMGQKKLITNLMALLAFVFAMFMLNSTLVWAVIALVCNSLILKTMDPAIATTWQNRVVEKEYEGSVASNVISLAGSATSTLRSPVLGALVQALTQSLACAVVGAYLIASMLAFASMTRTKSSTEQDGLQQSVP